ncbi:hypothetical protein [Streptomyces sp. NPDC091259]|uniref:hypothetical protein n=1 Tax=Streptomyces sp. NPDC091259 TaxID=3365976 RepID=UPI0038281A12
MAGLPLTHAGYVLADVGNVVAHVAYAGVQHGPQGLQRLTRSRAVLCYGDAGTPQKSDERRRRAQPGRDDYRRSRDERDKNLRSH